MAYSSRDRLAVHRSISSIIAQDIFGRSSGQYNSTLPDRPFSEAGSRNIRGGPSSRRHFPLYAVSGSESVICSCSAFVWWPQCAVSQEGVHKNCAMGRGDQFMQIKQMLLAGCAIAAIGLSPAVASAQDTGTPGAETTGTAPAGQAAESTTQGVGDIVVTARRVEERLQDIPIAVSALSGAQLTQQGIREVRDLNAMVPTLSVQQAVPAPPFSRFAANRCRTSC
jgi:hypothetical protein